MNANEIIRQFSDAMRAAGITPPETITPDGVFRRFSGNDNPRDDSGWYILFGDGIPAGLFGDHRKNIDERFRMDIGRAMTPEEERAEKERMAAVRAARKADEDRRHAEAARRAALLWKEAQPAGVDHPYLIRKKVKPVDTLREIGLEKIQGIIGYTPKSSGEALRGRLLLVPVKIEDELSTLELIDEDGRKTALAGGAKAGGLWVAQLLPTGTGAGSRILIGEGVATVLTAREATGFHGVAALCCSNLPRVAAAMRTRFPASEIIVLADVGNGQKDAEQAAHDAEGLLAMPNFTIEEIKAFQAKYNGKNPTDFNDLAELRGIEGVNTCIESAIEAGKAKPRTVPEENNAANVTEWPDPKPIKGELFPVPAFDPAALLPEVLRDWVMDEADRMPCPPDYIAAAVVVELGAVIGARCAMKPKGNDDWIVVPNLWGGVVGHPTSKKTPAINAAFKPLDRLAAVAREEYDKAMKEHQGREMKHEALKEAYEAQIKSAAKKSVKPRDEGKTGEGDELDGFIQEYQKSFELQDLKTPAMRRYKTNDGSIEKIGEILRDNPAGLLVLRDELVGLLASWERAGHEEDRAFYLEAWNGMNSHDVDRIGRGSIRVPNLCLSLFGGIQPDKLVGYLEEASNALANDGMLQRFQVLVYPDHRRWEWRDRRPRHDARERVFKMFDALGNLDPEEWGASPADEHVKIPCFRFSQEAQAVFIEWSRELNQERITAEPSMLLAQHVGKYEKLFAALSLIFHLVDCTTGAGRGPVSRDCALRAAAWCDYLEAHARRCYGLLQDGGLRAAQALSEKIEAGEITTGFTARDVLRNQWRYLTTAEAVDAAIEWLEDEGWLIGLPTGGNGPGSGRKTYRYTVNPKVKREGRNV